MMASDGRIVVRGLARRFGTKAAVHPFDVEIEAGVTGLLGPNGSGKSTFLRMLVGLVRPDRGTATVAGARLAGDGTAVRRRCAYMPGETTLYGELSGGQHLAWFLRGRGAETVRIAVKTAADMELPLGQRVRAYSHGMKRQLQLAAALAPRVPLRILDEPTEGLDPTKRAQVLELLRRDALGGATILLSSHHLAEVDRVCGRLLFLNEGELISVETPEDLEDRARRLVRLTWAADLSPDDLEARLSRLAGGEVRVSGRRASILLEQPDPRDFLVRLARDAELPPPETIVYGKLSLAELYRDLYGVEGI